MAKKFRDLYDKMPQERKNSIEARVNEELEKMEVHECDDVEEFFRRVKEHARKLDRGEKL